MTLKQIRCFLRPSRTYRLDRQRLVCEVAAARLGLDVVWYIQGDEGGDRDIWVRQVRKDEIAMVPRLDLITGPREEIGGRPLVDYTITLSALVNHAGVVIEASTGAQSDKAKAWKDRVAACANLIAQGRDLQPEVAREMARKSHRNRSPVSKVKLWADPSMAKEIKRLRVVWRSREYYNDDQRFAALPADAREAFGSKWTARAVLGQVHLTPSKAGRPKSTKQKT